MHRLGMIVMLWMGVLLFGAAAGTYTLLDGTRVSGDPLTWDETGVSFKQPDGSYTPRVDWGKFSDDALRQLREDARNPHDHALVDPLVSDEMPSLKAEFRKINVTPVVSPPRASGRLGLLAIFSSPLGWVMLLILYGVNLYAAYEIAIFRNQPAQTVCGLAAIPLFGVGASLYYLASPTRARDEDDAPPSGSAAGYVSSAPMPLPSQVAASQPAPSMAASAPTAPNAPRAPAAPLFPGAELPAPIVYRRGDFSFNRRFFETKLTGFFRVVLSEADKDLRVFITSSRGTFVGKRIPRITQSELYLEVFKEEVTAEEMIPFTEIMEVQVRHKDLN